MADRVLVAGAGGGLGQAVVSDLVDAGRELTVTAFGTAERERLEALPVDVVEADLTDADAVAGVVAAVPDLAAVVNLVGGYAAGGRLDEADPALFARMLALNLDPAVLLARAAMPRLVARGGGSFVAVSARAAVQPFAGASAYITAKAALLGFVRALDADYAPLGVRANAILPSVIDTPANRAAMPDADRARWVAPARIARVVRFLVSEDSQPVSGAAVPV